MQNWSTSVLPVVPAKRSSDGSPNHIGLWNMFDKHDTGASSGGGGPCSGATAHRNKKEVAEVKPLLPGLFFYFPFEHN